MSYVNKYTESATYSGGNLIFALNDGLTYSVNIPSSDTNFANTNLTFTGNRTHDVAGHSLNIVDIGHLKVNGVSGSPVRMIIDGDNATDPKILSFRTGDSQRWAFRVDGAGDDLLVRRYDNTGTLISNSISMNRLLGGITINENINIGTYSLTNGSNNNLHLDYLTSTYLYNGSSPNNYNSLVLVNSAQVKIESYSTPLGNTFSTIISTPTSVQMSLNSGFIDYTRVIISNTNNKVGIVTNLDSYYFPRVDGISGQVLMTDGSGDLYWGTTSTYSPSSRLTAWDAYNTNGLLVQTSATTWTGRTITSAGNPITITNGNGVSGNPTIGFNGTYTGTFNASGGLVTSGNITAGDFIQNSSAYIQTTNATATTLKTIPTTSETIYHIEVTVIAGLTTTNNGYTMKMFLSYKNNGGTLTQIGYGNFFQDSDWTGSSPIAAPVISGTNILIRVTGLAATNIDWYCYAIVRSATMGV